MKTNNCQIHIMNYSKTREVYCGHRKVCDSKTHNAEHGSNILIHKATKKAFDDSGMKKLPFPYPDFLGMKCGVY